MLIGVGRPGLSRGVLDDVRDALAGSLWYMRHEGGRYRFTTEPNLNKIIAEQEGAVSDGRILQLLREATTAAAPTLAPFRVETNVAETMDIADEPRLALGVLNTELTADGDGPGAAEAILNHRGSSARANKNAVVVVAADSPSISRARQTARTVAAMQDITGNQTQLKRFNQEQKRQLTDRLAEHSQDRRQTGTDDQQGQSRLADPVQADDEGPQMLLGQVLDLINGDHDPFPAIPGMLGHLGQQIREVSLQNAGVDAATDRIDADGGCSGLGNVPRQLERLEHDEDLRGHLRQPAARRQVQQRASL